MLLSEKVPILRSHKFLLWFLTATLILLTAAPGFGQVESGRITGVVRDPSNAAVPNAAVKVKSQTTGAERTVQTGNIGQYLVPALTPGIYQVTVTVNGFKTFQTTAEVTVGGVATVDAKLQLGESSSVVEVIGGSATEVNTSTQEVSQLIDTRQMAQLPSLTRNPYDFVALSGNVSNGDSTSAGASNDPNGNGQSLTSRGAGFSLNGQRESGTEILLDGAENISIFNESLGENVPMDAVQEYSIVTNNYSPEYGRASGGVVNVTTKPGSNAFHGTAYEYNRLSAYTANTYNNVVNGIPKGQYTRNQFGFQAGGPIIKNKLFISESTEWTRIRSQSNQTQEILDPSFIALLPANVQNYYKTYGTGAYPATGQVTAAQLAAAGVTIGNIGGVAAIPGSQPIFDTVNFKVPFDAGGDIPGNQYTLVGRLDYNLTDKTQMFFRAGREAKTLFPGASFYSAYPQYDVGYTSQNQSYLYSLTHTFSSNLINNAKASFTRFNTFDPFDTSLTNTPNLMFVSPTDPVTNGFIQMPGLENSSNPGTGGLPYGGPQNTLQFADDLSWTKGKHNMKFGGLFTYIQLNVAYGAYAQAVEELGANFQDSLNDLINTTGNPAGSQLVSFQARVNPQGQLPCVANPGFWTSNSVSDLNTNASCAVTPPLTSASYGRSYRYKDWAVYAMDSFRLTPRLTFNYGLRYEHYGVQHNNIASLDSNFYFGPGSGIEQQTRTGGVQIANHSSIGQFWAPRWGTLAPRVGFAYDLFGNGETALRGGYGISYERNFGNVTYNASFNPPASAVLSSVCAPSTPGCATVVSNNDLGPLGLPGPASYLPPLELRMPDPNIQTAQTQFWSLTLEQSVAKNTIFGLSYSGAHGVHLYDIENINLIGAGQAYLNDPLTFASSPACTSPCLNRPNNQYSNINMRGSLGSSSYNAANIHFQTQNLRNSGLSLVANYTWAKSLDDLSSTFGDGLQGGSGYIGSLGYTDLLNPKLDWGPSDYDVRQRLVISPIWETPWHKNGKGLATNIAGGWSFVGVFTARTGIPFSVYDYNNDFNFYTVPRLTPATPIVQYKVGSPVNAGANLFNAMTIPVPASFDPLNSALGISDFGPFPANMTRRNAFRGPGAWNWDMSMAKKFKPTERMGLEFRAEGFNIFNHHNYYVNPTTLAYSSPTSTPIQVTEEKGGLNTLATGGNHDERRFGQLSLRVTF